LRGWVQAPLLIPPLKAHSGPRSQPILGLDMLEVFFEMQLILGRFLAQAPELAESSHPRLAALRCTVRKFVREASENERTKRNPTAGEQRIERPDKISVGNFERVSSLHVPYLWVTVQLANFGRTMLSTSGLSSTEAYELGRSYAQQGGQPFDCSKNSKLIS